MFKISLVKRFAVRILPGLVALGLAVCLAPRVFELAHFRDDQAINYDAAIKVLEDRGPAGGQDALGFLKSSFMAYKSAATYTYWERLNFPAPDRELAALGFFHAGNVLRKLNKPKDALGAYVQSLRLNSGQTLLMGVSPRDDESHQYARDFCVDPRDKVGMSQPAIGDDCQLLRLQKEADDTRYNIMSLLDEHPELAKLMGNPQGLKEGAGDAPVKAKSGDKHSDLPGVTPAPSPGHNDDRRI